MTTQKLSNRVQEINKYFEDANIWPLYLPEESAVGQAIVDFLMRLPKEAFDVVVRRSRFVVDDGEAFVICPWELSYEPEGPFVLDSESEPEDTDETAQSVEDSAHNAAPRVNIYIGSRAAKLSRSALLGSIAYYVVSHLSDPILNVDETVQRWGFSEELRAFRSDEN